MSNQNRFLLPHQPTSSAPSAAANSLATRVASGNITPDSAAAIAAALLGQENEFQVDTDFDSYWEEEARNPHRNRIRIGRQYQATVPPLLKQGERDRRKLEDLETLSFCPKRSAKVTAGELDNYFAVAKSLNLFASLVETRSLLGRDVTIADLNRIRHREGLSLASVIQPPNRQTSSHSNVSPQSSQQQQQQSQQSSQSAAAGSPQKSPSSQTDPTTSNNATTSGGGGSPSDQTTTQAAQESQQPPVNKPLMKALSHFISLHHPCYHNDDCKKLQKDIPLEDDSVPAVNLRATSSSGSSSSGGGPAKQSSRSRSKQQQQQQQPKVEDHEAKDNLNATSEQQDQNPQGAASSNGDSGGQSQSYDDWTREDVELLSKAIEVCGKKFGSIKKEFLPSKSVRSIVEYYYVGSRDVSDGKRKSSSQAADTTDGCSSSDKTQANNNSHGGNGGNGGGGGGGGVIGSAGDGSLSSSRNPASTPAADHNHQHQHRSSSNGGGNTTGGGDSSNNNGSNQAGKTSLSDQSDTVDRANQSVVTTNRNANSKQNKSNANNSNQASSKSKTNATKNIDARMSVYNFDDEMKDDANTSNTSPPLRFDGGTRSATATTTTTAAGAEVKPLKAKPILPNAPTEGDASNSNVGSLKFFMDGQLVLKLNACQEQQEGGDKCHWVQSGDKLPAPSRQKRYSKRANSGEQARQSTDWSQNGSQSNSVVSSQLDEDSTKTNDDLSDGEDSKESANSFAPRPKSFSASPTPKRLRQSVKTESSSNCASPVQVNQPILPIDYNRLAVNNRMKETVTTNLNNNPQPQLMNQAAAAAAMPWLQANSFAMAAALLQGLPFPGAPSGLINAQMQNPLNVPTNINISNNNNNNLSPNNNNIVNLASSKPMDLSVEHQAPKPIQTTAKSRSRSKQKNS